MKTAAVTKIGNLRDPDISKRGKIELIDFEPHELGDEDVKIKVAYCAICGSDPHTAEGSFGPHVPQPLGHEISGVIEALGKNATKKGFKIGDHVAGNFLQFCGTCYYCQNGQQNFCRSMPRRQNPGMSDHVMWHESQVYKLPDGVSLRQGCILEPLSVAVRAADKVSAKAGQRIAISGGGPIGQLILQVLRLQGATSLTMIEPIAQRRELATKFGAQYVIDPVAQNVEEEAMRITDGFGFDIVCDVSGAPAAVGALPAITAKGGTLLYGAMYPVGYMMPFDLFTYMYRNELTITGLFLSPYTFPRAVQLIPHIDLAPFIEKAFPLDQVAEAFDVHLSGEYLKVLIRCNDLD
ncbi:MAG: alcohol dehydrogenase catalytic domain-containing protein [Oscillospiraceae bacterium]|nr:alcohol dehydrogenase catalytic domain-containing protein [Oscillospiraceae bacterium]